MKPVGSLLVVLALLPAVAFGVPEASAKEPRVLEPLGAWNVHWDESTCYLGREFGTRERPLVLRFERFAPDNDFGLMLVGDDLSSIRFGQEITVSFGPGDPDPNVLKARTAETTEGKPVVLVSKARLREAEDEDSSIPPDVENAIGTVALEWKRHALVLETGLLGKPFEAFRSCTDNLVSRWGFDPAEQRALKNRPRPSSNPGRWILPNDYPLRALTQGMQGIVNFVLMVDAEGMPTGCTIASAVASDIFKKETCHQLMDHARFDPALNAAGSPVASFYAGSVTWIMG
ncbi:hypothetical protein GCM10011371_16020 [Novosphingobium marinum]|nr:hypothetical protein GCM10011371_16020 [Novosphingobium marinum]